MDKVGVELGGWRHKWENMSKVVYTAGLIPSPCLHKKLRHFASIRRTRSGFCRQQVDHLIWPGTILTRDGRRRQSSTLVCFINEFWKAACATVNVLFVI